MLEQLNKTPIYDANIPAKYTQKCMSEARFIFRRKEKMIEWAKKELAKIEHDEDGMQDRIDANILELLEVLSKQGHSNFSANYVLNAFDRLSHFLPLTPLTGEDDEWNEYSQNKRCPMVFKDADGRAYNSDGKIFSNDGGKTWFTNKDSRVYISFPYMPPRHPEKIILNTEEREVSFKGSVCPREYIIKAISYLNQYVKLEEDMKLIKEAVNDSDKNGFDVCRLIKSITDEYDFEEAENETN